MKFSHNFYLTEYQENGKQLQKNKKSFNWNKINGVMASRYCTKTTSSVLKLMPTWFHVFRHLASHIWNFYKRSHECREIYVKCMILLNIKCKWLSIKIGRDMTDKNIKIWHKQMGHFVKTNKVQKLEKIDLL